MVQRRERLGFTLEAREAIGVAGERVGQDLERDIAIQLRIARAKHLAHAAFAELVEDAIGPERVTNQHRGPPGVGTALRLLSLDWARDDRELVERSKGRCARRVPGVMAKVCVIIRARRPRRTGLAPTSSTAPLASWRIQEAVGETFWIRYFLRPAVQLRITVSAGRVG